jgi:hypothetical protein
MAQSGKSEEGRTLGLGLAVVSRILRNMNGQLRLKSEEGKGSRFVLVFPLDLPEAELEQRAIEGEPTIASPGSATPLAEVPTHMPSPSTPSNAKEEITLVDRGSSKRSSDHTGIRMTRQSSRDSFGSKRSMRSAKSNRSTHSTGSNGSNDSQADRLIQAIQEPHNVDGYSGPGTRPSSMKQSSAPRPRLDQRRTTFAQLPVSGSTGSPMKQKRSNSIESAPLPRDRSKPGTFDVEGQNLPIRSIRMPDELGSPGPFDNPTSAPRVLGDVVDTPDDTDEAPTADHMRVLVAEDDPVNSRIIKKRLEKAGHEVYLTVNGEECASAYGEKTGFFDIVLMDMQVCIIS